MKKGVVVIKPDFMNENDIRKVVDTFGNVSEAYKIDDFYGYSVEYRLEEQSRMKNPCKKKAQEVMQTIEGYKQKYNNEGLMLIIENNDALCDKDFFDRLYSAKKQIRNNYVANREYSDFLVTGPEGSTIITEKFSTYQSLIKEYGDKIALMLFNGVHLEDYEDFIDQFDYNHAVNHGIICSENKVDIARMLSESEMER